MIEWKEFDRIMLDCEFLGRKNRLARFMVKVLKRHKCWKGNESYCTWNRYTYELTNDQIDDISRAYTSMKTPRNPTP